MNALMDRILRLLNRTSRRNLQLGEVCQSDHANESQTNVLLELYRQHWL